MSQGDAVSELAQKRVGQVLRGKYRLDSVLGIGGMATVYAATHRNRKRFAVKILHADVSTRSDMRQRFLREGYVANSVDHPGAVTVLDDDVAEDGSAFLVMELLRGEPGDALWRACDRKMPIDAVLAMADQLLDVLAAAHAKSIVHRDIKPSNLFALKDGTLKVLDFGIARLRDQSSGGVATTGVALGTPAYMAPEQALARSEEIDGRSDIWAAGATIFSLASGQLVHEGENAEQVFVSAATKPARSFATVMPDASPALVALVDRALAFDRAARWPNAEAMRDAIRAAVGSSGAVSRAGLAALTEKYATPTAEPVEGAWPPESPAREPMVRRDVTTRTMPTPGDMTTGTPVIETRQPSRAIRRTTWVAAALAVIALAASAFVAARRRSEAPARVSATASAPSVTVAPDSGPAPPPPSEQPPVATAPSTTPLAPVPTTRHPGTKPSRAPHAAGPVQPAPSATPSSTDPFLTR